ncbi:PRC-barrel domain-containing protein [Heliophilum fasciatum]|uniref:Uncharacterized protein YrrD n=1 Tax=Heliophilum fasciatum TaxID=35700 RepID=A0A4R2RZQ9_9FIRM|nr:PRC-barrel domain-containing protein [Heliophilum fasciatum]MCW2276921.1 uncharacterized protein YrrD [Heliophilum fasciatum]TCP68619.1 uncharacterized protein YrrD [Heliophilum fasciatum]
MQGVETFADEAFLGRMVIAVNDGCEMGHVRGIVIDPRVGSVVYLLLENEEWYRGALVLPFDQILSVGEYAVLIESGEVLQWLADVPAAQALVTRPVQVRGTKVLTRDGRLIGRVASFFVDLGSGRITETVLEPAAGDQEGYHIPASAIVTFGREVLVVETPSVWPASAALAQVMDNPQPSVAMHAKPSLFPPARENQPAFPPVREYPTSFPVTREVQPQYPPARETQPQFPPAREAQPQYPPAREAQPQYPPAREAQPQFPPAREAQPQFPPAREVQPQFPPAREVQPQFPPAREAQPQYPPAREAQPQYPPAREAQPQYPPARETQPQYPPARETQPQYPPTREAQPQYPAARETQPQYPQGNEQQQSSRAATEFVPWTELLAPSQGPVTASGATDAGRTLNILAGQNESASDMAEVALGGGVNTLNAEPPSRNSGLPVTAGSPTASTPQENEKLFGPLQYQHYLGKRVTKRIETNLGQVIVEKGAIVTPLIIDKVKQAGRYLELIMNVQDA